MASSTAAAAAAPPEEDDTAWEGAEEEEVMVLVELPEFAGTDLFHEARSIEIRVRDVWGCLPLIRGVSAEWISSGPARILLLLPPWQLLPATSRSDGPP